MALKSSPCLCSTILGMLLVLYSSVCESDVKRSRSEGLIEVSGERVDFKEPKGSKVYFSIPLDQIKDVSTGKKNSDYQENVLIKFLNMLSEDQYLFIKLYHQKSEHTLQFSAHKASSVNSDIKRKILDAKSRKDTKNASVTT